jgi:DNA-binding MarR family transcriptional regulator
MQPRVTIDAYVIDTLLPDIVGHDRRPSAFLVYLFLLRAAARSRDDAVALSLQSIAVRTGLSKAAVQSAIRHLKRRGLLDDKAEATTLRPLRRVRRPWRR